MIKAEFYSNIEFSFACNIVNDFSWIFILLIFAINVVRRN